MTLGIADDEPVVFKQVSRAPFLTDEERHAVPPPPYPKSDPVEVRRRRSRSARRSRRINRKAQ